MLPQDFFHSFALGKKLKRKTDLSGFCLFSSWYLVLLNCVLYNE